MAYSSSSMGSSVGTTSTTSTSTSNGGAAASGSQSSSNGSFSTGKGSSSSNSGVGPGLSLGAGLASNTGSGWTSNSNGNFSGGNNGKSGSIGFAASNFGQGWGGSYSISPDSEGKHTIKPNAEGKHVVTQKYSKPQSQALYMTVDEVYGKGNQSMVENQGDYEASSNEKSNVETSTFGKQDEISVTPVSVAEDKGLVNNDAIQSVEGLNFQQKDKANQDVMEAKKSRDEAEAEDKSNQMRDQIKANIENEAEEESVEENDFQIGDRDEDVAAAKTKADEAAKAYKDLQAQVDSRLAELNAAIDNRSKAEADIINANKNTADKADFNDLKSDGTVTLSDGSEITQYTYVGKDPDAKAAYDARNEAIQNLVKADRTYADKKAEYDSYVNDVNNAKAQADKASADYNSMISETFVDEETSEETKSDQEAPSYNANIEAARNEIENSNLPEETKSQALETLNNVEESREQLNDAANDLAADSENPANIKAYVNAMAKYNKNLKNAAKDKSLKNTDFNKTFTEMVAKANDFEVTLADGTKQNFADFAAEMATKSPALAKGLYEAKAKEYDEAGHTILAQIERAKANMVTTWLGSKFTFLDNQVRAQFHQMAKTDMRATYATYNNVLNDPNASPEAKAEAQAQIAQANALMTASAALQASTGFLSGIGDSMRDGVYGVTNPSDLNAYQETLNAVNNFIHITLGLGATPFANEAYQNMYYMAGAKVNNSALFTADFDNDGFALCQEYGNNAAVGMIVGAGELATGITLFFNPATFGMGLNLTIDSVQTFLDGLYGVQREARKSMQYSSQVLSYLKEAKNVAAETNNVEVVSSVNKVIDNAISQIENFELKADEVGSLDNWLEGSGSNTATNEKFNQSLTYDEWLKLIEADPTMRDYAKKLIAEKKEK